MVAEFASNAFRTLPTFAGGEVQFVRRYSVLHISTTSCDFSHPRTLNNPSSLFDWGRYPISQAHSCVRYVNVIHGAKLAGLADGAACTSCPMSIAGLELGGARQRW